MKPDWKSIAIAFVLGILFGVLFSARCADLGFHGPWDNNPGKFHHRLMEQFTSKLHLKADQQGKVSAILEDSRAKIGALRQEVHPKFEAIRESAKAEIRKLLTPEQQEKFDQMSARMKAHLEKHRQMMAGKNLF